ncbi:glycosyltransferase [Lewinella sp. JB7]|uniref:glycosyltransferase n=1 Tax=Lewinella sp. JB7 TaxID=2962887 RepID=UPI0020C9CF8E|nr:glycosyltransferase [Lewinella sp. JB7]MCP9236777.1 glycosyltransferase [Lewinella sp. JB7]
MNNQLLVVTHAFPPMGGGGVQRIVKFAVYLKQHGWAVTVVCPSPDSYAWIDEERYKEVVDIPVIRIPLPRMSDSLVAKLNRRLGFIDPFTNWAKDAIKHIDRLDLSGFAAVLTSGPPHSCHLVGMHLRNQLGLQWVADFRDHFTLGPEYSPISIIHRIVNRRFERLIYVRADHIITNTYTNQLDIIKKFPEINHSNSHVSTIYNGFDARDLSRSKTVNWDDSLLHLIYLGGLRGDHIDGVFYTLVREAVNIKPDISNQIMIHVLGDISRKGTLTEELGIDDLFDFQTYVPYNEVGSYLASADAGITWQRDRESYRGTVAGKVFDYIGMSLPIFSVGQNDGEIARILTEFKIGISTSPKNTEQAAADFIQFCDKLRAGEITYSVEATRTLHEKFDRTSQALQLATVLNKLL